MTRYSVQPRYQKVYLSLTTNMGNNVGKNINQSLSSKYSQKRLDYAKKSASDALKTAPKKAIQTIAE